MKRRDKKKLYKKYTSMALTVIIIILMSMLFFKCCSKPTAVKINDEQHVEYVKKEKVYADSIALLNMKIRAMKDVKDTVYRKYTEYKTKIVIQKEQLINNEIDTITILQTYDAALYQCDSLNSINDTIINMQANKMRVLDSVISNSKTYNNKLTVDIATLNKQLKKQKTRSTGKTILWSIISGSVGFGAGVVTGILK